MLQKALLASFLDAVIEEKKGGASSMKPLLDSVDVKKDDFTRSGASTGAP